MTMEQTPYNIIRCFDVSGSSEFCLHLSRPNLSSRSPPISVSIFLPSLYPPLKAQMLSFHVSSPLLPASQQLPREILSLSLPPVSLSLCLTLTNILPQLHDYSCIFFSFTQFVSPSYLQFLGFFLPPPSSLSRIS